VVINGRLSRSTTVIDGLLNLPRVPPLIVDQTWIVVALVEKLENGREDLWFLVWQRNPLVVLRIHNLPSQDVVEERRCAEDVLVSSKDPLLLADDQGHNGRGQVTGGKRRVRERYRDASDLIMTYLGDSAVPDVVAVAGRRRGSWRRLDIPASLLNDDVDLPYLWLLEKLLF
jgi:hypothetical protein